MANCNISPDVLSWVFWNLVRNYEVYATKKLCDILNLYWYGITFPGTILFINTTFLRLVWKYFYSVPSHLLTSRMFLPDFHISTLSIWVNQGMLWSENHVWMLSIRLADTHYSIVETRCEKHHSHRTSVYAAGRHITPPVRHKIDWNQYY
jgi:hypothetical protein